MKGYIQVYTGDGKGKTTAAIGLAVRAACAGLKVFVGQFLKGMESSEVKIREFLPIEIVLYGNGKFVRDPADPEHRRLAQEGLRDAKERLSSGKYDLVVLDEFNVAIHLGLLSREEVEDLLDSKPEHVELVITGRYAPNWLIERADLVTEMREVKHYFQRGVTARRGIEY